MPQGIYLDNSTTTRPSDRVVAAMLPFMTERWGIPSAPHAFGLDAFNGWNEALPPLYEIAGASEDDDLILAGSGAEAVNQAIFSCYEKVTAPTGKNQFITSVCDEAPVILAMGRLEQFSCVVRSAAVNKEGKVTAQAIADVITPRTAMVSLSWANGLTGVIHPVAEIGELCKERGILFHLEASHIIGKLFFEFKETGAHFLSFGADHIHGPKGAGILYIRQGTKPSSFILGGYPNMAAGIGTSWAAREAIQERDFVGTEIARLRDKLEAGIIESCSDAVVLFADQERVPTISCIGFQGVANEALLYALNRRSLYASMGGGSVQQIALVLEAAGMNPVLAQSALSFSLSRETTEEQIDRAIDIIADTYKKLRKASQQLIHPGKV